MRQITSILFLSAFILGGCKKDKTRNPECIMPQIVPPQPYSEPAWHPNGQLLGFNFSPLAGVAKNGTPPCTWYFTAIKPDSTGFYIMNKDGTGLKRITNFNLSSPAWSPDGNWIAFSLGAKIYKMQFANMNFDTANIIQLTNNGANFFPSWTANSDTIYYDSNVDSPPGTSFYSIWKMAINGSSQTKISPTGTYGRQPFIGSNNLVYYQYYSGQQPEIFSMEKDGSNQKQLTFNGKNGIRRTPKYYRDKLFFWDGNIFSTGITVYAPKQLTTNAEETYAISTNGEIVYANFGFVITDRRWGTLWIMNTDGTNNRQLTFNNY